MPFYRRGCGVCELIAEREGLPLVQDHTIDLIGPSEHCNVEQICRVHEDKLEMQYTLADAEAATDADEVVITTDHVLRAALIVEGAHVRRARS